MNWREEMRARRLLDDAHWAYLWQDYDAAYRDLHIVIRMVEKDHNHEKEKGAKFAS